jgi:heme ABC exporter ATP-binding subunit CcmA
LFELAPRFLSWITKETFSKLAMVMKSVISLKSAVVNVANFPLLAGIDLEVYEGERLLLTGANGSGKTSLLKLIAGLLPLSAGEGKVLSLDLKDQVKQIRKSVFYLGHTTRLYDELTAEENLDFYLRLSGISAKDRKTTIQSALNTVGLGAKLAKTRAKYLSFGQKRRLNLATLLVRRPKIVLLDEPHANLDNQAREFLNTFILNYTNSKDSTLIFSSHEISNAIKLATRMITLKGGAIASPSSTLDNITYKNKIDVA